MADDAKPPKNLEELLQRLLKAADKEEKVSLDQMMDEVGRRSFGPLLLLAGMIISAPLVSDIPGVPTVSGLFILLVAGQVVVGRERFWLPKWMLNLSVKSEKLKKTIDKWLMRPAKFIDRFVGRRLEFLTGAGGTKAIAIVASLVALATPMTELVPMSANGVGIAIVIFGLALIAKDGVMAMLGFVTVGVVATLAIMYG
ncbi:exopolysaccharide biosynthesis protein [Phragmitibacter flavus]|uniref:Exopolysaccharide biosynthesis protein n=1 Tax=Phragmitibacter flavus TaxID=2576071 RepID=A0A5R8KK15_9BACT|nr:exopolysaccharide biosynthesis protein [Phragmitibacter flavus]TLD72581.1 exopolysaccharide biosynthesis protein [Phragmitibacter flavus]